MGGELLSLPTGWKLCKVGYVTSKIGSGKTPKGGAEVYSSDGVIFLRSQNVYDTGLVLDDVVRINYLIDEEMANSRVRPGDVLLNITGASIGRTCIVPDGFVPANVNQHVCILRIPNKALREYVSWVLKSLEIKSQIDSAQNGAAREGLNFEQISKLYFTRPEKDEELKSICAFLDHETAKIDTLIEKQQQLIKLLKEKRQTVIGHAVTKGLDPNVPMKDSNIGWLGEVPEHWLIKRLKHISPKIGVGLVINPSTYTKDEGVYFIFGGDVKEYGFNLTKTRKISPEDSERLASSRLSHRDLVSIRVGYPGVTAVVPIELEGANCASVVIIRKGHFNSDWLCAAMNTWIGRQQVDHVSYGAAQKQYNVADAVEFIFPVPPETEQDEIADFINNYLVRFNLLVEKAEEQISLLKERRTALISAAVTGKIDVRNFSTKEKTTSKQQQQKTKEAAA